MTRQNSAPEPLDSFINKLGNPLAEDDLELTGEEIADILWLGLKLQEFGFDSEKQGITEDEQTDSSDDEIDEPETTSSKNTRVDTSNSIEKSPESKKTKISDLPSPKAPIYSLSSSYSPQDNFGNSSSNLSIKIPDPQSLKDPLDLIKSLRLLMQRVPSGRKGKLDEEATVKRIVDEENWVPVLEDELEPWLDLALVIDESQSMLIWNHYIEDLIRLFKQYGMFRELTIWGIKLEKTKDKNGRTQETRQFIARNGSNSRNAQPEELLDATRRRLILIASDCVADLWRKGIIFPTLQTWTAKQQVAILQMLPRVMWRKSALGLGMLVNFSNSRLGVANKELTPSKKPPFLDEEITLTHIPILSLDKEPTFEIETENRQRLFKWTEMLLGKRDSLVSGYLLPPELQIEDFPALEEEQKAIDNQTTEQRIARFRRMTSPMGRKLASLLAAAPVIRLPIVRLIQESMLPQSDRAQLAEVFLGGLLKPKAGFELDINTDPETVEYEFIDSKIRDIFVEEAPISDSIDVVNAVSRLIAEQIGVSMSNFMAMLKGKQNAHDKQQEDTIKPFAEVTARVLQKLGGNYAELANELISSQPHRESISPEIAEEQITLIHSLSSHSNVVRRIAFTPDGKYLVSGSNDCTIRIWDWASKRLVNVLKGHEERVKCIQVSENSQLIVSGSADNTIKIWNIETGQCIRTIKTSDNHRTVLNAVVINFQQNLIITGSSSGKIKLWNWHTGERIDIGDASYSGIRSLAISSDGKILVSGSEHATIKVWHLDKGLQKPHHIILNAHMSNILSLEIYSQTLVSGGKDNAIKIWDLTSNQHKPNKILDGHEGSIRDLAISPDGTRIVSASMDSTIKIWNLENGEILKTLTEHSGGVRAVNINSDGNVLATGAADNTIKIWNISSVRQNKTADDDILGKLLAKRNLLAECNKTKLYSLLTNEPWKIPFDGFVISSDLEGGLASSFRKFIGENEFARLKAIRDNKLNERKNPKVTLDSPVIFYLPSSVNNLLNTKNNYTQESFIICATISSPKPTVKNTEIAVNAIIRLVTKHKLKRLVIPLLGTGGKKLPIRQVAETMLSAINKTLKSLFPNLLEEITLVNNLESTIVEINQVAKKFQNQNFNYSKLANLLNSGKWKEADEETANLFLQAVEKTTGSLNNNELERLSCEDLNTIDQLWRKYSNGHFGFTIQSDIWLEVGGQPGEHDDKIYQKFGERVGWYESEKQEWYGNLRFNLQAPKGHLPFVGIKTGGVLDNQSVSYFAQKLIDCQEKKSRF